MRLRKAQKEAVLKWIAEGARTDEINAKAKDFKPPFHVDRQQVDYYRKTRRVDLLAIKKVSEEKALIEGFALKEHRVYKLSILAALFEKDLFGGFLWVEDVKGVGTGDAAEVVDFERFNSAEVMQYRGVLDDIAKEVGGRKVDIDASGNIEILVKYADKRNNPQTS